jgi:FKBP-type peptidyl-prolyl cis-trans isomerase SlyD
MEIIYGRVTTIHFFLTDDEGTLLDSSEEFGPLTFVHGKSKVLPALEEILLGKQKGDKFEATFYPEEAYGQIDKTLFKEFSIESLPSRGQKIEVGILFETQLDNKEILMRVIKIEGNKVFLDGNHPFVGKKLHYIGKVLGVRESTSEELKSGFAFS